MQPLNLNTLPLTGTRLIEASAGTGKTYTIATLYLRLLLEQNLEVDQILVVTFTEAATEELRGRIRERIDEAHWYVRLVEAGLDPKALGWDVDANLRGLMDGVLRAEGADGAELRQRLEDSLTRMDEAAVYTIHGFCQRALQENAFESGIAFDTDFITDQVQLIRTIVQDFWRQRVTTLDDPAILSRVLDQWATPDQAYEAVRNLLHKDGLVWQGAGSQDSRQPESPESLEQRLERLFQGLKTTWQSSRASLIEPLQDKNLMNLKRYSASIVPRVIQATDDFLAQPGLPGKLSDIGVAADDLNRMGMAALSIGVKGKQTFPEHGFYKGLDELLAGIDALNSRLRLSWYRDLVDYIETELEARKTEQQQMYFDDLLLRLDAVLNPPGEEAAPAADRLANLLCNRYPVALIDEFQDTDPQQYRIFSRIYRGVQDQAIQDQGIQDQGIQDQGIQNRGGLFMIGDPKQAIYSFRGADIFTYMKARRATLEDHQYTLNTNWRSAARMVEAVGALFSRDGVQRPFRVADIDFQPVQAGPLADKSPLTIKGQPVAPMQFWHLPSGDKMFPAGDAKAWSAQVCAERILELLQQGQSGEALIGDRPLVSADMAVLVRTHAEAETMQQALRQRGIASVSLSKERVFDTQEAVELERLMQALLAPGRDSNLSLVLAGAWFGHHAQSLYQLQGDELAWEALTQRFLGYQAIWREQGVLSALMHLLEREQVLVHLRAFPDGERRITNLLQLLELAQIAEPEQAGMDGLLRWYQAQRLGEEQDETRQLRLESDSALVQIVTIHKSKGLEYPVVFLPFPWTTNKASSTVLYHDEQDRLTVDLDKQGDSKEARDREDLAERLRLLYVAVTRAKYLCVMPWGRISGFGRSALAWLLHQQHKAGEPYLPDTGSLKAKRVFEDLEGLKQAAPQAVSVTPIPDPVSPPGRFVPEDSAGDVLQARPFSGKIKRDWRLVSYSSLLSQLHATEDTSTGTLQAALTDEADHDAQSPGTEAAPLPEQIDTLDPIFLFPRGARAGTFLHGLLEHLDFTQADAEPLLALSGRSLLRHGFDEVWAKDLARWMGYVLDAEILEGVHLRDLSAEQRLNEMNFVFPVQGLNKKALAELLMGFEAYQGLALRLQDMSGWGSVLGLMKGAIDLIFERDGRYFIADYKSNHLGDRVQDYDQQAMQTAMDEHFYDLQYLIYSVALHRYLQQRLTNYDYDTHMGGSLYLFLRGMRPGANSGIVRARPPKALVEALDGLMQGGLSS